MESGWDLGPLAEAFPLPPGCGVFVDLERGKAFGDSRVCRRVYSRHLAAHNRRHSLQGEGWGEVTEILGDPYYKGIPPWGFIVNPLLLEYL